MAGLVRRSLLALALVFCVVGSTAGQGIYLAGSGAINRGMGGATTGAAIESIGSMYWNPATISGLNNEIAFGFEGLYNTWVTESTFPQVGSGKTGSESGAVPIPSVAWVHQTRNPYVKLGVGLFGVAGYTSNMPTDPTNPIVSPPPVKGGVGLGRVQATATYFQMPVALSVQLTDRLSIAAGPTLTMGSLPLDENAFVTPNADGTYPRGNGTRYAFGGGAQIGLYYVLNEFWSFGVNLKSPSWMESFRYRSEDAAGLPRVDKARFNLPAVLTGGLAFNGFQYVTLTADAKYIDYNNTDGFGDPAGFAPDFSVTGLGWKSVFAANFGARFQLTHRLFGMLGYGYVTDLLDDADTFFNTGSDLSYQHYPSAGASFKLSECVMVSCSYFYVVGWESTGPFVAPGIGPIPGSSITNRTDAHAAILGVNVKY